ncbi:unnamed protein product [Diabrotica balteata]|uniref:Uncharacterized protein n=1 Tax=Diabrotica balteata TaxID=107213 RepID=A0A9N9T0V5_DIABA|nr:unnamed protein product [Diabrotica balteata]
MDNWINENTTSLTAVSRGRGIAKLQFGRLFATAWEKSATVQYAVSSFKATIIVPFDKSVIPEYAYLGTSSTNTNSQSNSERSTFPILQLT